MRFAIWFCVTSNNLFVDETTKVRWRDDQGRRGPEHYARWQTWRRLPAPPLPLLAALVANHRLPLAVAM